MTALGDAVLIVGRADGGWQVEATNPVAAAFVVDHRLPTVTLRPAEGELEDRLLEVVRTGDRVRIELKHTPSQWPPVSVLDVSRIEGTQQLLMVARAAASDPASGTQPRRLTDLLAATTETVVRMVEASEPLLVRKRFVHGLVQDLGMAGVALWATHEESGGLTLAAAAGLPPALRRTLAQPRGHSALGQARDELRRGPQRVRIIAAPRPGEGGRQAAGGRGSPWSDHHLYLTLVPDPAEGVLGIFVEDLVPAAFEQMLPTLARAYASAVSRAQVTRSNQRVVDSLVRQLRPASVDLPPGLDVGFVYQSATAGMNIGGDLYDWFVTDSGHVGLAVGDVAGKGVQAASLTALAVYSLRAFALHGGSPHLVLKMLNSAVSEQTPIERFLTLIYVRIDPVQPELEFALGGHPPPIIVTRDGVEVVSIDADLPVGIEPDAQFRLHRFTLDPDASLVLYTDGVTEARAPDGSLLGLEGLVAALDRLRGKPAQEVADGVWRAVEAFTVGRTADDCAIVILRRPR